MLRFDSQDCDSTVTCTGRFAEFKLEPEAAVKTFGQLLMWIGAAVGAAVGIAILAHAGLSGVPWLVNVALAKLGILSSFGLMGGGAVFQRLAARRDDRALSNGGGGVQTPLPR